MTGFDGQQSVSRTYQESFLRETNSDDDIDPQHLSGDQSAERSVLVSDIGGKKSNFLLTVTTIMKTVIGAGILSLPLTISRLGYGLAIAVFAFIITADQFTCILLLKAKNLSRHSNYSSIIYHIFQNKFVQALCSFAILLNNIGICIAELTLFKGALKKIIDSYVGQDIQNAFYTQPWFIVIILALLQVPFTLVNKIEKLKFMAFLGVAGVSVFLVAHVITFFTEMAERDWDCSTQYEAIGNSVLEMGAVIPNIMLSLSYQMNFFPIFKGMKDSRDGKMKKASISGILACSFFYILVGNMGACRYGRDVQGNFLLSFTRGDIAEPLYILLNLGFLISVFFSFPVMFFGARNNFIAITKTIILSVRKSRDQKYQQVSHNTIDQISSYIQNQNRAVKKRNAKIHFYIYTLVLYSVAVGVAILVDDIEDVFNIVGAVASNAIAFIFPTVFYIILIQRKNKTKKITYYMSWVVLVIFIPLGLFALISNFLVGEQQHLI